MGSDHVTLGNKGWELPHADTPFPGTLEEEGTQGLWQEGVFPIAACETAFSQALFLLGNGPRRP